MANNVITSDCTLAALYCTGLRVAAEQLSNVPIVCAGDTNHGVNDVCCSIYGDARSMAESYYNAAERDADRIVKVADTLAGLDEDMGNEIGNYYIEGIK